MVSFVAAITFATLLAWASAAAPDIEDGVYVGTDDNLHDIVDSTDYTLLEFYAPCMIIYHYDDYYL